MNTDIEIGSRIKEAREAIGLSQSQLALHIGHPPNTIQAWEQNKRHPRPRALERLAKALGVPVASFYADSSEREAA